MSSGDTTTGRPSVGMPPALPKRGGLGLSSDAARIRQLSVAIWGEHRSIEIIGHSEKITALLGRLAKIARYQEPVLILGESGVGKELMASAIYLLSRRVEKPFISVNCPQYLEGNLTVSELFGHQKGSFTGAVANRKGCFETANGGVIFLDEIGDLHLSAQVMLLRALATGEFQPLGAESSRRVNVRVVAATNRSLNQLATKQHFRRDLIFRLRYFLLEIPPLRDREDDWRLLVDHTLKSLHCRYGVKKTFSKDSLRLLESYSWPGNVRELVSVVTTGYALSDGDVVSPRDFADHLEEGSSGSEDLLDEIFRRLVRGGGFWERARDPFLSRDLNRRQLRKLVARGLRETYGSYRKLTDLWHLERDEYQRFMDFLRHHRLKPTRFDRQDL
jgi:DNA-binding NtrC family response regulator